MSSEILDSMVDVPPDRVVGRILVISVNMIVISDSAINEHSKTD